MDKDVVRHGRSCGYMYVHTDKSVDAATDRKRQRYYSEVNDGPPKHVHILTQRLEPATGDLMCDKGLCKCNKGSRDENILDYRSGG